MYKKIYMISVLFVHIALSAQTGYYIKIGTNTGIFQKKDNSISFGKIFGIGLIQEIKKYPNLFYQGEILFVTKGGELSDVSWLPSSSYNTIYVGNIQNKVTAFEIPIIWKYVYPFNNEKDMFLGVGFSYCYTMDHTMKTDIKKEIIYQDFNHLDNVDYVGQSFRYRSNSRYNSGFETELRIGFNYYSIGIEVRYCYSLHELKRLGNYKFEEKMDSMHFILNYDI